MILWNIIIIMDINPMLLLTEIILILTLVNKIFSIQQFNMSKHTCIIGIYRNKWNIK